MPAKEIRFPPDEDDLHTLQVYWRQRLTALRDAGVETLQNPRVYEHAIACKPHAFSYAGSGKVCRLQFCPFCNAADAAAAYERVRRVVERRKDIRFLLKQTTERLEEDTALADSSSLSFNVLGSVAKRAIFPNSDKEGVQVQSLRILTAVSRQDVLAVYRVRHKLNKAMLQHEELYGRRWGWTYAELGLDKKEINILCSGNYAVRPAPLSLARAVGHLYQYPAALLTAPANDVAAAINRTAHLHLSGVRGVFRSPHPLAPKRFPLQFVPTNRYGQGIADKLASLLPDAEEGLAARQFSRLVQLPSTDSFAAISSALNLPCYWLGMVEVTMKDLARPSKRSALYQAVSQHRPPSPGHDHALFCVCPGLGLIVLSTLSVSLEEMIRCGIYTTVAMHVRVRGKKYTLEPVDAFGRRFLQRRAG